MTEIVPCANCGKPTVKRDYQSAQKNRFCNRQCFREARKRRIVVNNATLRRFPVNGLLPCNLCRRDLPESNFRRTRKGRSWAPWCLTCDRERHREYQKKVYRDLSLERERAEMAADRARLKAWIEATDVQPRIDGWGQSQLAAMGDL